MESFSELLCVHKDDCLCGGTSMEDLSDNVDFSFWLTCKFKLGDVVQTQVLLFGLDHSCRLDRVTDTLLDIFWVSS